MPQPPRQGRRATIGWLLLAGLVAAAGLIFFLDDLVEALRDTYPVVAMLPDGARVRKGGDVWVAGQPVGRVTAIEQVPPRAGRPAELAVRLELPEDTRALLRVDSEGRLTKPRPIADPVIDLRPGSPGARPLGPGDTIWIEPRPEPAALLAQAGALAPAIDSLMAAARALEPAFERRRAAFARLDRALAASQAEFAALSRSLENSRLVDFLEDERVARSLARAQEDFGRIADLLSVRSAEAGEVGPAFAALSRRAERLERSVARLRERMAGGGGFLARMSADSALAVELRAVQAQLDTLVAEAKKQPWKYVF